MQKTQVGKSVVLEVPLREPLANCRAESAPKAHISQKLMSPTLADCTAVTLAQLLFRHGISFRSLTRVWDKLPVAVYAKQY